MLKRILRYVLVLMLILSSIGCTKGGDANTVAKEFNKALTDGSAFRSTHQYKEYNESSEVSRDKNGNIKFVYVYEDGQKEEVYKIGEELTIFIDGENDTENYSVEELQEIIDFGIDDVLFYPEDSLQVFDVDIESSIEENDEGEYVAYGTYDEGTDYHNYYGTDGSYFKLIDLYDEVRVDLDETVVVELP